MPLVRVRMLGTPNLTTCPHCRSGDAFRRRVVVLTDSAVEVESLEQVSCLSCGYLAQHRTA